jgi:hypothetical protein
MCLTLGIVNISRKFRRPYLLAKSRQSGYLKLQDLLLNQSIGARLSEESNNSYNFLTATIVVGECILLADEKRPFNTGLGRDTLQLREINAIRRLTMGRASI